MITNAEKKNSAMSNKQTNCCSQLDFQKVDQQTKGKWLTNGTKQHKDNQLYGQELPYKISWLIIEIWWNESDGNMGSII